MRLWNASVELQRVDLRARARRDKQEDRIGLRHLDAGSRQLGVPMPSGVFAIGASSGTGRSPSFVSSSCAWAASMPMRSGKVTVSSAGPTGGSAPSTGGADGDGDGGAGRRFGRRRRRDGAGSVPQRDQDAGVAALLDLDAGFGRLGHHHAAGDVGAPRLRCRHDEAGGLEPGDGASAFFRPTTSGIATVVVPAPKDTVTSTSDRGATRSPAVGSCPATSPAATSAT